MGRDRTRACFRFNEKQRINRARPYLSGGVKGVQVWDDKYDYIHRGRVWDFVDWVLDLAEGDRSIRSIWDVLRVLNICPEGVITGDMNHYIELEGAAAQYKIPPVGGSLEDMPYKMFEAFKIIRRTQTECELDQMRRAGKTQTSEE